MTTLTIGARGSKLALVQAEMVAAALRNAHRERELDVRIVAISTKGDRVLDVALTKIGDKGLFVKEIEQALLNGEIDLAVHSAKDLPSQLSDGLVLAAFMPRGDPRDALVLRAAPSASSDAWSTDVSRLLDHALAHGAHVGTSSLRRICQLRALRPDLRISDVRGNVDTRLRKLAEGQFDALVLAAAGLERLGIMNMDGMDAEASAGELGELQTPAEASTSASTSERPTFALPLDLRDFTQASEVLSVRLVAMPLPTSLMLPAVAQGALTIETRSDDARTRELLRPLNDAATQAAVLAERAFLRRLEGGCQVPIAAFAQIADRRLHIVGLVGSTDGATIVRAACTGDADAPEQLGVQLAERILTAGAQAILRDVRMQQQRRPLEGMCVVITRADGRNDGLAARLRELGAEPVVYPVIAYAPPEDPAPMHEALTRLMNGAYDWLVVTSATAVHAIESWMNDNGWRELPARVRLAAVGPVTAEACVSRLNRQPVAVPEVFTAQHLTGAMGDAVGAFSLRGQRVLLLNADIARPTLQAGLREAGAEVDRAIAYRTVRADANGVDLPALLAEGAVHAITFTSGSTVRYFVERIEPGMLDAVRRLLIVCIGPSTAEAVREVGLTSSAVATTSSEEGLVEALVAATQEKEWSLGLSR